MASTKIQKIKTLKKRLNYLEKRIRDSDKDLTFDKAEASAIKWAIEELSKLYFITDSTSDYLGLSVKEIESSEPYWGPTYDSEG
jgi:hypothetical protein